uniref:Uncharacterized protein n=1 Tax=Sphaerodactylus townsendi TaxID=933632 RepID=A0ACB8EIX2_9SAUR
MFQNLFSDLKALIPPLTLPGFSCDSARFRDIRVKLYMQKNHLRAITSLCPVIVNASTHIYQVLPQKAEQHWSLKGSLILLAQFHYGGLQGLPSIYSPWPHILSLRFGSTFL